MYICSNGETLTCFNLKRDFILYNTMELTKKITDRCDELMEIVKKKIIETAIDRDSINEDGFKALNLMFGLVNDCKELAVDYAMTMEQIPEINQKLDKLLQKKES